MDSIYIVAVDAGQQLLIVICFVTAVMFLRRSTISNGHGYPTTSAEKGHFMADTSRFGDNMYHSTWSQVCHLRASLSHPLCCAQRSVTALRCRVRSQSGPSGANTVPAPHSAPEGSMGTLTTNGGRTRYSQSKNVRKYNCIYSLNDPCIYIKKESSN